jgi:hypothetical protein
MGRPQTIETRNKIAAKARHWMEDLKKDPIAWNEYRRKQSEGSSMRYTNKEENRLKYLTDTPFCDLGPDSRRDKILLDQQGECNKCKAKEWFGTLLTLEIDHINGDHQDNRRENLRICPQSVNAFNTPNRIATSKFRGVFYFKGKILKKKINSC